MNEMLTRLVNEEDGQGMVEYGLIIAGVALAAIAAIWLLGPKVSDMFTNAKDRLDGPAAT